MSEPWPGTLCCVLGQDTFLVSLSTQVHKWALGNLMLRRTLPWIGIPCRGKWGIEILLHVVAPCFRTWDNLHALGSFADLTLLYVSKPSMIFLHLVSDPLLLLHMCIHAPVVSHFVYLLISQFIKLLL